MRSRNSLIFFRSFPGFLLLTLLLAAWLSRPEVVAEAAYGGLRLCARVIIPSLFPFFVLSTLFVRRGYHRYLAAALRPVMGPLFGLPADGAGALALGAVGGYPIGAATAFSLRSQGALTDAQAARLLAFCSNAGPGYVFGVVGLGLFTSPAAGTLLYVVHLLSAVLVGAGLRLWLGAPDAPAVKAPERGGPDAAEGFSASLVEAVRSAAVTMLQVCAFLVFFAVLLAFLRGSPAWALPAALLRRGFGLQGGAAALLDGLMELSAGVDGLRASGEPESVLLSACSFLLGWGGLCVHFQVLSLRGTQKVAMAPYFCGKLAQGLLSAVLIQLFRRFPLASGAAIFLLLLAALLHGRKKHWKNGDSYGIMQEETKKRRTSHAVPKKS